MVKRIGVLTGGGDCPGLNPAIKAITYKAIFDGIEVVGIRHGWRGLVEGKDEDYMPLGREDVRTIDRTGGTILGTSRTNPYFRENGPQDVLDNMEKHGIDALVAIGGDDTLGVAAKLFRDFKFPVVGVPKTIDRDLKGTDYTLGFESAVEVITESIDRLRTTAGSHERTFIVETMGRHSGQLALKGGLAGGAAVILIPEWPFEVDRVCELLLKRREAGSRYSIVAVAEGAVPKGGSEITVDDTIDEFGHKKLGGVAYWLADEIYERTHLETRSVVLSHMQRGGAPVAYDRRMGFYFGSSAVQAIEAGVYGVVTVLKQGRVRLNRLEDVLGEPRLVNIEQDYDTERYNYKKDVLSPEALKYPD